MLVAAVPVLVIRIRCEAGARAFLADRDDRRPLTTALDPDRVLESRDALDPYPGGRVQPYAAVGPALTLSVARLASEDLVPGLDDFYDARLDVGLDARGGIAVHVAPRVALFFEYRFTYLDLHYENEVDYDFGPGPDLDVDTILRTHHTTVGVSFRF